MEATLAYAKLEDGRSCKVSVRAWGFQSLQTFEGIFECYRNHASAPGYSYTIGVGKEGGFAQTQIQSSGREAVVCF